jgi:hypothetical protein
MVKIVDGLKKRKRLRSEAVNYIIMIIRELVYGKISLPIRLCLFVTPNSPGNFLKDAFRSLSVWKTCKNLILAH